MKEKIFRIILKFLSNRMLLFLSKRLVSSIISTRLNDHVKSFLVCDILDIINISETRLVHMKCISETGSNYELMIPEMNILYMITTKNILKKINDKYSVYAKKIL